MKRSPSVRAWTAELVLPTYLPDEPDRNPMFVEKRVYQGSSGRIYPLPFVERIAGRATRRRWKAVWLENEYLSVLVLPELGGRVHALRDRTNGYDAIYRQEVIKPALVGLAGPWVSGGIEFNWPQHHRPATFLPVEVRIEREAGGACTVWCGDHDPMERMKGLHGVRLQPGSARLELRVRAYNRTEHVQTFLWWANAATRVHERYQSFFPPDVHHVADHARRAMSAYPRCRGVYYGIDYGRRPRDGVPAAERPAKYLPPPGAYAPNDLSWYANIPTPCSYMATGSRQDFFGGYDHRRGAGLVHVADHRIAPGKKQWTWGNHEFGYAWDRHLTDPDANGEYAPYIELMAGVFTDNQPDFSFLLPGETKTWSQFWYPIQRIGVPQQANADAALSLRVARRRAEVGVAVTQRQPSATITLEGAGGRPIARWRRTLAPGRPFLGSAPLPSRAAASAVGVRVQARDGRELAAFAPAPPPARPESAPAPATEPPPPEAIEGNDELFLTGVHLAQYRHATRSPEPYWREALRRDPGDARCLGALGQWHLRRGEFEAAERSLRAAIARLTLRNANPADGEPFHHLGVALRWLGREDEAYDAFAKATWNQAWQAAGWRAMAEIDCARGRWKQALDELDRSLRRDADNLQARNLRVLVLRRLGRGAEAAAQLRATLALDPLDTWARHLAGRRLDCDAQVRIDVALDQARAGFHAEALAVLAGARPGPASGTAPLLHYHRARLFRLLGKGVAERRELQAAAAAIPDYCFPVRLEDYVALGQARRANPKDARAPYYLGNWLYDRRRHGEAIALWEEAAARDASFSVVWRNLGLAYFNHGGRPAQAQAAFRRARRAAPGDARLLFESDQLAKRRGAPPEERLRELRRHRALVARRDDLSLEWCALCNLTGRHEQARRLLAARQFQPWEGGEGVALGQHVRTHLALGRAALRRGDPAAAQRRFGEALASPPNLGEARHVLANPSEIRFWLGEASVAGGDETAARGHWQAAAEFRGDFQEMSVRAYSELTFFSALSCARLGRAAAARRLFRGLLAHARRLARTPARIDYFATSLPTLLVFEDDLRRRQDTTALFLEAQARLGLGAAAAARALLRRVLARDPAHAAARDLRAMLPRRRRRAA